jgi:hypothetical protein
MKVGARTRENLPEEQFHAILKKFEGLVPGDLNEKTV